MSSSTNKGILKIINDIKSKTLPSDKLIESIKEIGKMGNKFLAHDLIPLLDEFDDEDILFHLRETLAKLRITPDFLNDTGLEKEDEGDYDDALQKFELSVKLDPKYYISWYNMARIYGNQKKNYQKAIELFEKALSINPTYGPGWNSLGNVYYDLKQFSLARQAYERAIQCVGYKGKHYPYYNSGLVYEKMGYPRKALEYFLKSVDFKQDYSRASYNAGRTYRELGEHEKAYEYFAMALKYDLSYEKTIRELGVKVEEVMTMYLLKKLDKFKLEH
ncbi:MAG: tetratricopeptide repeat protein [Candidatus Helarchaeota archaeon]|nr:tetratricopeptide repeat protein [Candidatus Helarchaeota archaeon]